MSEQRRRLEKALRGCAEGWTPQTTDPWPAIRERVDGTATSATEAEPWATYHLGFIFDRQGEYDLAVGAYQQVIALGHPEAAPRAAFNLGILFEERGEYHLAEQAYQQAIDSEHAEWTPKAVFNLGMLFEEREEYARAEEAYQQAINSGHPEVAPKGMGNLRALPMRSSARAPTQPPDRTANFSAKGHPAP